MYCACSVYKSGITCTLVDLVQPLTINSKEATIEFNGHELQVFVMVDDLFDKKYRFTEMPTDYCMLGGKTIEQPKTITSTYSCGVRCDADEQCEMFTTTMTPEFKCWFHYSGKLSAECNGEVGKALYSLPLQNNNIIKTKSSTSLTDDNIVGRFNDIGLLHCIGICQKSASCKSSSHDQGVCTLFDNRDGTYQEGRQKFRPVNKKCINDTKSGRAFSKRDFNDCMTLCSRLNEIGECDTFEHSIDGICHIYTDDDNSCKLSFDDTSSNVYSYAKDAIVQSTSRITDFVDIDYKFRIFLSKREGYSSMSLLSNNMMLNNVAEINLVRILDVVELVESSVDLIDTVYDPISTLISTIETGENTCLAIFNGLGLITNVSSLITTFHSLYFNENTIIVDTFD